MLTRAVIHRSSDGRHSSWAIQQTAAVSCVTTDQQDVELISQRQDGTQRSALAARDLRLQWLARAGSVFVGLLDTRTARSARSSDLHAWSARQAYAITRYCNPSVTHLNRRYWSLIDSMQRRVLTLQTLCDSTKDCWAPLPARLIAVQLPHLTHDYATILFQSGGRLGRSINPGSWSGSAVSFASGVRGIFLCISSSKIASRGPGWWRVWLFVAILPISGWRGFDQTVKPVELTLRWLCGPVTLTWPAVYG